MGENTTTEIISPNWRYSENILEIVIKVKLNEI
jgi:hypothetical protein